MGAAQSAAAAKKHGAFAAKAGWLAKSDRSGKSIKKRWFQLEEDLLFYFVDDKVRAAHLVSSRRKARHVSARN